MKGSSSGSFRSAIPISPVTIHPLQSGRPCQTPMCQSLKSLMGVESISRSLKQQPRRSLYRLRLKSRSNIRPRVNLKQGLPRRACARYLKSCLHRSRLRPSRPRRPSLRIQSSLNGMTHSEFSSRWGWGLAPEIHGLRSKTQAMRVLKAPMDLTTSLC